jgi:hypothetical protein
MREPTAAERRLENAAAQMDMTNPNIRAIVEKARDILDREATIEHRPDKGYSVICLPHKPFKVGIIHGNG